MISFSIYKLLVIILSKSLLEIKRKFLQLYKVAMISISKEDISGGKKVGDTMKESLIEGMSMIQVYLGGYMNQTGQSSSGCWKLV